MPSNSGRRSNWHGNSFKGAITNKRVVPTLERPAHPHRAAQLMAALTQFVEVRSEFFCRMKPESPGFADAEVVLRALASLLLESQPVESGTRLCGHLDMRVGAHDRHRCVDDGPVRRVKVEGFLQHAGRGAGRPFQRV